MLQPWSQIKSPALVLFLSVFIFSHDGIFILRLEGGIWASRIQTDLQIVPLLPTHGGTTAINLHELSASRQRDEDAVREKQGLVPSSPQSRDNPNQPPRWMFCQRVKCLRSSRHQTSYYTQHCFALIAITCPGLVSNKPRNWWISAASCAAPQQTVRHTWARLISPLGLHRHSNSFSVTAEDYRASTM